MWLYSRLIVRCLDTRGKLLWGSLCSCRLWQMGWWSRIPAYTCCPGIVINSTLPITLKSVLAWMGKHWGRHHLQLLSSTFVLERVLVCSERTISKLGPFPAQDQAQRSHTRVSWIWLGSHSSCGRLPLCMFQSLKSWKHQNLGQFGLKNNKKQYKDIKRHFG